ncbi:hypothetical protein VNI00_018914 [Paramarasmius palmivorus]|uniref:Uncharacterized protein n=1 Tax=Paramarasmius palmivorus TaxID=297713 RepID=A0AAW0AUQ9_9AGAR
MQGNCDFPPNWKTLASDLEQAVEREGVTCGANSSLPSITRLRQGLFLALAVSPLVLLCDITPMSNNLSRIDMLRAWYHYGTERPPFLRKVETMLWARLFAVAKGAQSAIDALKHFTRDTVTLMPLAVSEQGFFASDAGVDANMPVGLSYQAERASKKFVALSVANCLASTPSIVDIRKTDSDGFKASRGGVRVSEETLDLSSILESKLWDDDNGARATTDFAEEEGSGSDIRCCSAGVDSVPSPEDSSSFAGSSTSSKRVRRHRAVSCTSQERSEDERVSHTRKRKSRIGELTKNDLPWPALIPYTWKKRVKGSAYLLVSPDGRPCKYWPSFYLTSDLDMLSRFFAKANQYQRDNGNEEQFLALDAEETAQDLGDKIITSLSGSPVLRVYHCGLHEFQVLARAAKLSSLLKHDFVLVKGESSCIGAGESIETVLARIGASWITRQAVGKMVDQSWNIDLESAD